MDNVQNQLPPLPPLPELPAEHKDDAAAASPQKGTPAISELKTPPPPPPPVAVRSLQSDLKSLEASGGTEPKAEMIKLDDLDALMPSIAAPPIEAAAEKKRGGIEKAITSAMISLIFVVGVGFAGYQWVYPALFSEKKQLVDDGATKQSPAPVVQPFVHRSLFAKLPTFAATVSVQNLTREDITAALQQEAASQAIVGAIKELAFTDKNGSPLRFSDVVAALLPGMNKDDVQNMIDEDVTGFLYYNEKGVWPGYIAKLKATAVVADTQATFAALEGLNTAALYLRDPGAAGSFQTGPFNGSPIRYSVFAAPGASLNYGVVGDYIVIATSFDAFKASIDLLGF